MGPSTFTFMLRWQLVPFVMGIALVGLAAYGLFNFHGDPPDAVFSSFAGMFGRPLAWCSLVIGLCTVGYAWFKASELRHGI